MQQELPELLKIQDLIFPRIFLDFSLIFLRKILEHTVRHS